jgi:hypothetical protein
MVTATPTVIYSPGQWRRQILAHRDPQSIAARAGFVAATFVDRGDKLSALVEIERVSAVLLFEECSVDQAWPWRVLLRLVSYGANRVPRGVQWGGEENSQLFKDLTLTPQFGARGQRIDKRKVELLSLAGKMNRRISRAARHPAAPSPTLRLPRLWAGFQPRCVQDLCGKGPEFEEACHQRDGSPTSVLRVAARTAYGLVLYPLDWVSDKLERATTVFAELTPSLRRQVFRIEKMPSDLIGFRGAWAFDFFHSRYRRIPHRTNVAATAITTRAEFPLESRYQLQSLSVGPIATVPTCVNFSV